jgi:hypothetical protein
VNEHQELAIEALQGMRGDNLYRARHGFKNMTPEQMNSPYGESDQTPAEILEGYELHEKRVLAAIEWVKNQTDERKEK